MAVKRLTKKAKKMLRTDVLVSVALTSLLLNVFFIAGIVSFASTNALDDAVYDAAYSNLCVKNYEENVNERMEEADSAELAELAKLKFDADCHTGEFTIYFQNAVEAFLRDQLQ